MTRVPSQTWRMLSQPYCGNAPPKGLDAAWRATRGLAAKCLAPTRRLIRRAEQVLMLGREFVDLTDSRLSDYIDDLRARFRCGRETSEDVDRAFALISEAAHRRVGKRPYLVQVAGALALESGCITEMATGEGKTLTGALAAVVAGWRGRGCHVLTVNDYLAQRDAELMQDLYSFCGIRVAWVQEDTPTPERRLAYQADVTHCTNKEVVGDFLRDRLAIVGEANLTNVLLAKLAAGVDATDRIVLRGLPCAIVDEADSILIDEAVTPLIISGDAPNHEQATVYEQANALALKLQPTRDFHVDERYSDVRLTNDGRARVAELAGELGGLWAGVRRREELVSQSLHARFLMRRGDRYVVDDDKVVIVDGSTGRLMPDRAWRDGLHQAVEAKEGLVVNSAKETLARISFQRFFRLYRRLSGMTGTAREAANELWLRYERPIAVIPPNRPCRRRELLDRVFVSADAKWRAVVDEARRIHTTGQPLLIGTRSVQDSEHLSSLLDQACVSHRVLNAVRHAEEAAVVAKAGQSGAVTVATNMAGRGTDIKLGRGVGELGGLHVLATEKHESSRVDRQLYGRAGRQGDPGSAQAFISMEDELVIKHAPRLASICRRTCATATNAETQNPMARRVFTKAQRNAERRAHSQRDAVQRTDDWLDDFLGFARDEY